MTKLSLSLSQAVELLREARLDASTGLPEELFLLISSLIPVPNVDLLITNEKNDILLARRNDCFFEKSWHIPGGCIRYGETMEERIQKTALDELGCPVEFQPRPLAVRSVWRGRNEGLKYPAERGHNIAVLFACRLPKNFHPDNGDKTEEQNGFLRWFHTIPEDFMTIQHVYDDVLTPWIKKTR